MIRCWALALILAAGAGSADPVKLFSDKDLPGFGQALREAILADPYPIWTALKAPPQPSPYEAAIRADLARLQQASGQLFDPGATKIGPAEATAAIALFIRANCPACDRAKADLTELAASGALRVTLFDVEDDAALAERIGVDMAPSYVLPNMIVRGHVPAMVIEKYLSK